jgi:glycosyltransferase involved in cell wall biosynthesis
MSASLEPSLQPEVTVVIPTRDRWDLLSKHALRSALSQEDVELEVIVVDDGSTDGTATRLAGVDEPRLRVLRHEQARGQASARNTGVAAANATWTAFLDDDDLWSPHKLRIQLDTARVTGADFVYGRAVLVYDDGSILPSDRLPSSEELSAGLLERDMIPAGASNIIVRTELVRALGGFDERLPYSADWELWIRLALAGRGAPCNEVLVAHFKHRDSDLLRHRPDVVAEFDCVLEKHMSRVDPAGASRTRRGLVEWLVHEYRRAGYSRARAYMEALRRQPTFGRTIRAAGDLFRERVRRVAMSDVSRTTRGAGGGPSRMESSLAPDWLQMYGSGPGSVMHTAGEVPVSDKLTQ